MPDEGAVSFDGRRRPGRRPRAPRAGVRLRPGARAPGRSRRSGRWSAPLEQGGVIDPDVLWSCTTCGACVEQCPVDIEHVDHIVDMRRHQVLIESEFPSELGALFKNLENKGNPWGQNARNRLDWTKKLDFEVPVFDGELPPRRSTCSGSAARARSTTGSRRPSRPPRSCCTGPAWATWCWARRSPAPVTRPGARATSSCSRCWRRRTSRCSTRSSRGASRAPARSSRPARTA